MNRHIIYIINPIAGTRKKAGLQEYVAKRTKEQNIPFDIFPSVASGDYSFLKSIIKEKNTTDIVIAGGDGTVSQVAGSLMDTKLNFGIIPCGSGNGLALAAGISKKPEKALDIIFTGKAAATDGFYINDHFACMLCGVGFDAKVAHDFANQPKRGLTTYIKQTLSNFFSAKTYRFELVMKNNTLKTDAYFISIANSNQFGNNFTIAPKASLSDGLLDIVIVTHQNKLSFILQTIKQVAGRNKLQTENFINEKKSVIYFQTDELVIKNLSEAPMHIDGDPAETPQQIKVKIAPACFHLIQPA